MTTTIPIPTSLAWARVGSPRPAVKPSCTRPRTSLPQKAWRAPAWTPSPTPPASTRRCSITTFRDKDALYGAVLDEFFSRSSRGLPGVLDRPAPRRRALPLVRARALRHRRRDRRTTRASFMGEMMSAGRGGSPHLDTHRSRSTRSRIACACSAAAGRHRAGEFRAVEPMQFMPSAVGTIVHYFTDRASAAASSRPIDPFSTEASQQRRAAVLDFIAAALFADRDAGREAGRRNRDARAEANPDSRISCGSKHSRKTARRRHS